MSIYILSIYKLVRVDIIALMFSGFPIISHYYVSYPCIIFFLLLGFKGDPLKCLFLFLRLYSFLARVNFWGYSTVNYFAPMLRYSSAGMSNCGHDAISEFKTFVREAHKRGIEVQKSSFSIQPN